MNRKLISHGMKVLLGLLMIVSLFFAFFLLPILAEDMAKEWAEIEYAVKVLLPMSQGMMVVFVLGLVIIIYLLRLFDLNRAYDLNFTKGLTVLAGLCLLAVVGLVMAFVYLSKLGGPGPGPSLVLLGLILVILIVMAVILLVKYIILDAMKYKEEVDLTV